MRILFVGDTWQGSNARSLREALDSLGGLTINDFGLDHYLPRHRAAALRLANRVLRRLQLRDLEAALMRAFESFRPDLVVVHKGSGVRAHIVRKIQRTTVPIVNVFPDCSPWAQGPEIREVMGLYDLVISTKVFHPKVWRSSYGYENHCVWVPTGYDPSTHAWDTPAPANHYDVVLCATWRTEYHRLMIELAGAMRDEANVSIAIAGAGWAARSRELPRNWHFVGPRTGRGYGEFLRSGRIAIAPVTRHCMAAGTDHPGDEDSTRTYELAAAYCFFLHQRTELLTRIYDEHREVPLWSDATELARLIRHWLPKEQGRREMAARAHVRAVPAYSFSQRAIAVLQHLQRVVETRRGGLASA